MSHSPPIVIIENWILINTTRHTVSAFPGPLFPSNDDMIYGWPLKQSLQSVTQCTANGTTINEYSTHELRLSVAVPHVPELAPRARGKHHGQERARHDVQQRRLRGVHQEQRYERRHQTQRIDWK